MASIKSKNKFSKGQNKEIMLNISNMYEKAKEYWLAIHLMLINSPSCWVAVLER